MRSAAIIVMTLLGLAGCTQDMERRFEITRFRMLGVRAEPTVILADTPVALTALLAVPTGESAPPQPLQAQVAWVSFAFPSAPDFMSADPADLLTVSLGDVDETGEATLPGTGILFSQEQLDLLGSLSIQEIPVYLLACNRGTLDVSTLLETTRQVLRTGEIRNLGSLSVACIGSSAQAITAFKVLSIHTPSPDPSLTPAEIAPNQNPKIQSVITRGTADETGFHLTCARRDDCRDPIPIAVTLTPDSFEFYRDWSGALRNELEHLYLSFFVDGGEFNASRIRADNAARASDLTANGQLTLDHELMPQPHVFRIQWTPPRTGGQFHLWVIARDLRGGIDWHQYDLSASLP